MFKKEKSKFDLLSCGQNIYSAALDAVSPEKLMKDKVLVRKEQLFVPGKRFDLTHFENIYVVAFGKSAPQMSENMLRIMGKRIKEGVFVGQKENQEKLSPLTYIRASHPLPDSNSVRAAKKILFLAEKLKEKDLMIALISGGGSSLICLPPQDVKLSEKRKVIENLLRAGADIKELNAVRKHISLIKGGRLSRAAFPATVISLIISDVIGNDLEAIASGPTYWDSSTFQDSINILKKYHLWGASPEPVKEVLKKGVRKKLRESVKKGDPLLRKTHNFILGDNTDALEAAAKKASQFGFKVSILSSSEKGEARERAKHYISLLLGTTEQVEQNSEPICWLSGGELTVTVKGSGKGGRNQEFVLAFINEARKRGIKQDGWIIISLGTDGIDGPTDAAGAWGSVKTLKKIEKLSMDPEKYLACNDSYQFFKQVGGLIKTGPTQTNVMDLRILIVE
ncbi:MAG TPA: glycerate kinase [Acidobacteriota bacterium]|nr:glycerate kinase [Acidobacteriota bacterium]